MTIENAMVLNQLNPSYPRSEDLIKEGDDHIRLIKRALRNTFKNIDVPLEVDSATLNDLMSIRKDVDSANAKLQKELTTGLTDTTNSVFSKLYPVGSLYLSTLKANPADYLGFGTWVAFGAGNVIGGIGSYKDAIGGSGSIGESAYGTWQTRLSTAHMPSHNHYFSAGTSYDGNHQHRYYSVGGGDNASNNSDPWSRSPSDKSGNRLTETAGNHAHSVSGNTSSVGSGRPFSTVQPTIGVYIWKRTA